MNKRILAMLIAVTMLFSAFILAGCNNENGEESTKELTAKELFEVSLKNLVASTEDIKELPNTSGESKFEFSVDKLLFGETDITQLGKISITGTSLADGDKNVQASFELSAFGEKVPFEMIAKNENVFLVDFFGLNDKAIKVEVPESTGEEAGVNAILQNGDKIPAILEHVTKSIETVLNANLDDSAYSMEDKDDTKVITLSVDNEKATKIASELIDELLKNEDIKEMFGEDFDKTEALKEIEDFKSLRVVNTVVGEESIGLSAYIDCMVAKESDSLENTVDESDVTDETSEEKEIEKEEKTFGILATFADRNFSLDMGFVNAEGNVDATIDGAIVVNYKEESDKFEMSFKVIDDDKENELISAKGDIIDGEYDGTLYLNGEGDKIEVDFYSSLKENEGKFGISKIKIISTDDEGKETTEEIPLELTVNYKYEENKTTADGKIKLSIAEAAEIEASFNMVNEIKDVTIEPISAFVSMNEFDLEGAMVKFGEKYPTINSFITMIGGSMGGAAEDEKYFEKDGMGLWLPSDFEEVNYDDVTACYSNGANLIFTYKDSYDLFAGYGDFDFEDYVNDIYVDFLVENPTEIKVDDYGIPYFEFTVEDVSYYVAMYEGYDAYWTVMFCCKDANYEVFRADFIEWSIYADPYADMEIPEDSSEF